MGIKDKLILIPIIGFLITVVVTQTTSNLNLNNPSTEYLTILILLMLVVGISWLIIDRITSGLNYIITVADTIANGDLNIRLDKEYLGRSDEIGLISRAFYYMLLRLRQIFASLEDKVRERTEKLAEIKATDEAMLTSIGEAVIAVNTRKKIIFVNDRTLSMFLLRNKDLIGLEIAKVLKFKNANNEDIGNDNHPVLEALKGKKVDLKMADNYSCIKKDGTVFPINLTVSPIYLEKKIIGAISIIRDITEDKKIDKAKTEFVSLASHQLRSPLTAINWFADLLGSQETGTLNKKQKEYIDTILSSSKNMSELVNSLLNVARIDLGNFAIEPQPYNIVLLARSSVNELTPLLVTKKVDIILDFENENIEIPVDLKLMTMVFQNLLSNAAKYSRQNGKIRFSIKKSDGYLQISVKDDGIGIPKEDNSKVFSKFFRSKNAQLTKTEGTGLGLYIIKNVLEEVGGKIWYESELDKGTEFFVRIPLSGMQIRSGEKKLT